MTKSQGSIDSPLRTSKKKLQVVENSELTYTTRVFDARYDIAELDAWFNEYQPTFISASLLYTSSTSGRAGVGRRSRSTRRATREP